MRIAIVGTGISGSLAARLLSTEHDVTVFEANDYAGGHANTVDITAFGQRFAADTGFMVFNDRTYPNFCRLLELLKIPSQQSDMSFSVNCSRTGLQYQGSSLNGLFAQRTNFVNPSFWKLLRDITRFNRCGMSAAANGELRDGRSVGDFIDNLGLGQRFVDQYLVPMAAAIWSSKPTATLAFPAEFMIGFFSNHGLMQIRDRPQWRTIIGGSRRYVSALLQPINESVRLGASVQAVVRHQHDVEVILDTGVQERFEHVVLACHADQSLTMLRDSSSTEQEILGAFPFQSNTAVLHTDIRLLPSRKRAWASWNYHIPQSQHHAAALTYDLSRLQQLESPSPILLTLNNSNRIDPKTILRTFLYDHPAYSSVSITAQARHHEISGNNRTHFCGAYWGYGFHEDGVNSGLAVARHFGIELEALAGTG